MKRVNSPSIAVLTLGTVAGFAFLHASTSPTPVLPVSLGGPSVASTAHKARIAPTSSTASRIAQVSTISLAPGHELEPARVIEGESMKTTHYADTYLEPHTGRRIEVVGSVLQIHESPQGKVVRDKLARWERGLGRPLSETDALSRVVRGGVGQGPEREVPRSLILKVLPNADRTDARLVYWVDFADRLIVIDAVSGETLHDYSKHRAFAAEPKVVVYSAQGLGKRTRKYGEGADVDKIPGGLKDSCQLVTLRKGSEGVPILIRPELCELTAENSTLHNASDEDSARALENSKLVGRYYADKHGRSSFDGKGAELVSVVHVGEEYDNAFWDEERSFMAYGDGDGTDSGSYTRALDIVGHEMTHGVTAATAQLMGDGEPGALNEAYSDFFGVLISSLTDADPDWTIGKEVVPGKVGSHAPGMRSLARPSKFKLEVHLDPSMKKTGQVPYPSRVSEQLAVGQKCSDANDQCEVHGNATIPGHASFLIAKALEDRGTSAANRYDRAGRLYYAVLTQWLTEKAGFAEAARDTIDACRLMFSARDCALVAQAFERTEIVPAR